MIWVQNQRERIKSIRNSLTEVNPWGKGELLFNNLVHFLKAASISSSEGKYWELEICDVKSNIVLMLISPCVHNRDWRSLKANTELHLSHVTIQMARNIYNSFQRQQQRSEINSKGWGALAIWPATGLQGSIAWGGDRNSATRVCKKVFPVGIVECPES